MVELRGYAHEIQDLIGMKSPSGKNSADEIDEDQWLNVIIKGLNEMCIRCAKELEKETGTYPKNTPEYTKGQPLEKAPPTRLLSLSLILSYWLGWVNNEKNMDADLPYQPFKAWTRIHEAYMAGRQLSDKHQTL
jgi:hypothetical protein